MEMSGQLHVQYALPQDRTPVPTEQRAGWAPEPVWTVLEKGKPLVRTVPVFEPRPVARSWSL